jgi:hypothetical protein
MGERDMTAKKKPAGQGGLQGADGKDDNPNATPLVTGQCAQVLNLIRQHQPIISLRLTADYAIPEAAARVHDLRAAGWNIFTTIHPVVVFRGIERRNVSAYSLGVPEWTSPEFRLPENVPLQAEIDLSVDGEG